MLAFIFFLVPAVVIVLLWVLGAILSALLVVSGLVLYGAGKLWRALRRPRSPFALMMDEYERPWLKRVKPEQRRMFR